MKVVYEAANSIDAHLVRGWLQAAGIDAWVRGEHLGGGIGELPAHGLLAVCVRADELDPALAALRELECRRERDGPDEGGDDGPAPGDPDGWTRV